MAEQIGTPGSLADSTAASASKTPAPKDKPCPFCAQPFTSSSLGRHLDLYIREKNPKPADGVHNVDEIKRMRGTITRRQPRNSLGRGREGSTPGAAGKANGTSNTGGNGGDGSAGDGKSEPQSPVVQTRPMVEHKGKYKTMLNSASWHATGVMNNIPSVLPSRADFGEGHGSGNGGANGAGNGSGSASPGPSEERKETRQRSVSRQLAKNSFEQKQKMIDALDTARAAELALREILGSIKAAATIADPLSTPFPLDPLTHDFSSLTLALLPPPPTLHTLTPLPSPASWSILPPTEPQYEALRAYFRDTFHSWRISRAMHTPPDDTLSISPNLPHHSAAAITAHINASAQDLEEKISQHLHGSFNYWMSLPQQTRAELWRLELARAISTKSTEIKKVNDELEKTRQENAHLRHQIEQLSRCQMPREFAMCPPTTIPMSKKLAIELGEMGIRGGGTGLNFGDKGEEVGVLVERALGRWRCVVKGQRGLGGQKRLGAGGALLSLGSEQGSQTLGQGLGQQRTQNQQLSQNKGTANGNENSNGHMLNAGHDDMDLDADGDVDGDLDADGDADIDADGADYVLHEHTPSHSQAHTPSAIHHNPNVITSSNNNQNQNQQHGQGNDQHQQQQGQLQNQNRIPEAIMAAYGIQQQQQQQQNHNNNNSNMGPGNINAVNSGPGIPNQQSHGLAMQQMVVNGRAGGRVIF